MKLIYFQGRILLSISLMLLTAGAFGKTIVAPYFDITDFGATPDSSINSQVSIQAAIDSAYSNGGGTVYFPPGQYTSGTIVLKDNVGLHLAAGATLYASLDPDDYENDFQVYKKYRGEKPDKGVPVLIYAKDASHISITGKGIIDGRARRTYEDLKSVDGFIREETENAREAGVEMKMYYKVEPFTCMVFLESCEFITIKDISLIETTDWTLHFKWSDHIFVDNIYIYSSLEKGVNADGIDIDGCHDIVISNCIIETGDDSIVLKTTLTGDKYRSCENVTVTNCKLVSTSTALKLGTESYGDFRHITFTNCVVRNSNRGLSIVIRDGATAENIIFSDITVETDRKHFNWWGDGDPIWLVVKKRYDDSKMGMIRNVTFRNIIAQGQGTSKIEGFPGEKVIRNIRFDNVQLSMVPEDKPDKRATSIFAITDSEDIYCNQLKLNWSYNENPEQLWSHPIELVRSSHVTITNSQLMPTPEKVLPLIRIENSQDVLIRNTDGSGKAPALLGIAGAGSTVISSDNNLRANTERLFLLSEGADKNSIVLK